MFTKNNFYLGRIWRCMAISQGKLLLSIKNFMIYFDQRRGVKARGSLEGVFMKLKIVSGLVAEYSTHVLRTTRGDLAQGESLLDVGSGPILLGALLASSRFKHIVLSDLVEGNRLELNKWLDKSEDAIDWTHRAEQIAALEGYSDIKKGALKILERTRSAIRKVVPCDVLEPGVLPEEHRETFDIVMSNGCLESATTDHESFREALLNVGTLVKPGGLLILVGAGGLKSYPVGTAEFAHANLTEDALKQAVTDAGFQIKVYRLKKGVCFLESSQEFMFLLAARKA
ncbi:nicotinamide N-methyltransferase, putative [Ixodes scapularis]|uniref:Nicotinamide N-methyltransferase, putative n=1 Tax=Ixodes scapularis TaxID=6945 RepID=B7PCT2_IXOSC|nr:nicotinamide N-methyltransferase, putative [Ixodes scapularis]|eukprot:XP_002410248.1 nicotinamide N-methyltransferase, putative [Ixodes scapularis]